MNTFLAFQQPSAPHTDSEIMPYRAIPFLPHRVPDSGEPLDWLLILGYYAIEIPMYQITWILQLRFRQAFDPLKTREVYETMEQAGAGPFCRIIERGVDDRYVALVLDTAREQRKIILGQERLPG